MHHHVVSTAKQHLSRSVTVPVVGDDVELVAAAADHVGTGINPPEQSAVEFVGIDAVVCAVSPAHVQVGIILGAASLDDDFHLAVAIEVGHLAVVGDVGVGDVVSIIVIYLGKGYVEVARLASGELPVFVAIPYGRCTALVLLHPPYHSTDGIGAGGCSIRIGEVRYRQRCGVEFCAVAIDIVLGVVVLLS